MEKSQSTLRFVLISALGMSAASIGISIRSVVLPEWGAEYSFTQEQIGMVAGGSLIGVGFGLPLMSSMLGLLGYKRMLYSGFLAHVLWITLLYFVDLAHTQAGTNGAFWTLYLAMCLLGFANGSVQAMVVPLMSDISSPEDPGTNITMAQAGHPLGMIIGGLIQLFATEWLSWEFRLSLAFVPVIACFFLARGMKFKETKRTSPLANLRDGLLVFSSPLIIFLLLVHGLGGGTDMTSTTWIPVLSFRSAGIPFTWMLLVLAVFMGYGRFFLVKILIGRLRLSAQQVLILSAAATALGWYAISLFSNPIIVTSAVALIGLGISPLWPLTISLIGEHCKKNQVMHYAVAGLVAAVFGGLFFCPGLGTLQDRELAEQVRIASPELAVELSNEKQAILSAEKINELNNSDGKVDEKNMVIEARRVAANLALSYYSVVPLFLVLVYTGLHFYLPRRV